MTSTPTIDTMTTLGDSIQEAKVTLASATGPEAIEAAWTWLVHHANKNSLVISVDRREDAENADGTFTIRYF